MISQNLVKWLKLLWASCLTAPCHYLYSKNNTIICLSTILSIEYVSFDIFFIQFCSLGCYRWEVVISLDNGFMPNRQQAIIWTNNGPVEWYVYVALGGDDLTSDTFINVKCVDNDISVNKESFTGVNEGIHLTLISRVSSTAEKSLATHFVMCLYTSSCCPDRYYACPRSSKWCLYAYPTTHWLWHEALVGPTTALLPRHQINTLLSWWTHWGLNKMVDILQATFFNKFFWMKIIVLQLRFQ